MKPFRYLFLFFVTACGALGVPGQAAAEADPPDIRVGFSSVLSGPWAAWGASGRDGVALARDFTANRLSFDFQDDQCEPKQALSNVRKFLLGAAPDLLIMGCMEVLEAVAPVAKRHNLPVFSLGSITDEVLNKHPNVFALNAYADLDGRYIAPYLKSLGTIQSLGIVHGTNQVGEAMGKRVEAEVGKRGIQIAFREPVPVENLDFKAVIARINRRNPDAVWVHQSENTLITFVRQLRSSQYKGRIFTIFTLECDATRKAAGSFLNGVQYTFPLVDASDSERRSVFEKRFFEKYGHKPDGNAAIAFDALHVIDRAVAQCRGKGLSCYQQFFKDNREFQGVAGKLSITANRGAMRPYGMKEYRDGEFLWVEKQIDL